MKCPSGDPTYRAAEVFEEPCPKCGAEVEFFADDRRVKCSGCGEQVDNPRLAKVSEAGG